MNLIGKKENHHGPALAFIKQQVLQLLFILGLGD